MKKIDKHVNQIDVNQNSLFKFIDVHKPILQLRGNKMPGDIKFILYTAVKPIFC